MLDLQGVEDLAHRFARSGKPVGRPGREVIVGEQLGQEVGNLTGRTERVDGHSPIIRPSVTKVKGYVMD